MTRSKPWKIRMWDESGQPIFSEKNQKPGKLKDAFDRFMEKLE